MNLVMLALIACTMAVGSLAFGAPEGDGTALAAALKPHLRKTMDWEMPSLGKSFTVNTYFMEETTGERPAEVIIYVMNSAWERIGTESDLSILQDYIGKRFIVVTLDLGNQPAAVSPDVDADIHRLYRACAGYQTPSFLRAMKLDPKSGRFFILPGGYRVATDLTYWEIDKHAVHGTLEYIMRTYNDEVVPKVEGLQPAVKPADMVDRDGKPLDYRIMMDIVYPSQATRKCPVFVYSNTGQTRAAHNRYLFQLRGYVYVNLGHCFNPVTVHYWHFLNFTLDHWNGLACYTAGIRYLNKHADLYAMDTEHIGMMGISKGQYAVTRLSAPDNALGKEALVFPQVPAALAKSAVGLGKFPEGTYGPQPWPGFPSRIHCGWQGMGAGLWCGRYITPDYVPTILACGDHDNDSIVKDGTPAFLRALEKLDTNHVYLPMDDLGHSISVGFDRRLGVDRYRLVNDFFDRYLKVKEKLPPVVLIAWPRDGAENVAVTEPIWVQFAPVIDSATVVEGNGIQVFRLHEKPEAVAGTWTASHGGTKFTFVPAEPLLRGAQYEVSVTRAVKDRAGTALEESRTVRFKTAE